MLNYVIRRLFLLPLVLLGVTLIAFSMIWVLGPEVLVSAYIQNPRALDKTPDTYERLVAKYGLDQPLIIRYWKWLQNILKGDWGYSLVAKDKVAIAISHRLAPTLELTVISGVIIILLGVWLGTFMAGKYGSWFDKITSVISMIGWSIPEFITGLLVFLIFLKLFNWIPVGLASAETYDIVNSSQWHAYTHSLIIDSMLNGNFTVLGNALLNLIEPVLTLIIMWTCYIMRITRTSIIEIMHLDYIRTARAKGLEEKKVLKKHARRNALISVVTISGNVFVYLLAGAVIVESIFNRPGLGRFIAAASARKDFISVIATTFYIGIIAVLMNLVVDIIYTVIDPRVRLR
ncbi:MAG: ABC transporter permease [Thermotogae bacterium]|uniref:ABC transporter permease n=1 Tax=Kosmotoga sp. TaxID=1955248 RepID=UPI000F2BB000|nr:ABC transporter permease [Kosmotoga sp.]MCD6159294.1 ABC transporter permease [Kosmotoga sp.]RKX50780.1 MAG: ABC transporter permease [Thermotogota bacterium]